MFQQQKGNWQPYNVKAIVKNVEQVFKNAGIKHLNKPTYTFIIGAMGFIAHYDLYGFQSTYEDLRDFVEKLQSGELSRNKEFNLDWANSVERDKQFEEWYGKAYNKSKADAIRGIVAIARKYEKEIFEKFDEQEKNAEINQTRALAEKHGYILKRV